jgi:phage-related protein
MNKLALIVAYFLPKKIKFIAMLDWMDQLSADHLTVECAEYSLRMVKVKKEDAKAISDFIKKNMTEEAFTIKEPKGILDVAKQVRLVVGEGDGKIEVGTAEIEKLPDGDSMLYLSITNTALIEALGGSEMTATMPKLPEDKTDE